MILVPLSQASADFLTFPRGLERSTEVCCNNEDYLSCTEVTMDPAQLSNEKITLKDIEFTFSNTVEPHGFVYKTSQGDEAVLSYNEETGNLFGTISTEDGRAFAIEKCFNNHVWIEYDVQAFDESVGLTSHGNDTLAVTRDLTTDMTTMVTFSVKFYYTQEFSDITADIEGFIDQVIAETNEGYVNSKIPVRVKKFCYAELSELTDEDVMDTDGLQKFRSMRGSYEELVETADFGALLVADNKYCGYANLYGDYYGYSLSVTQKDCALGYYTFGHETAHNFGAHHDPDQATNSWYPEGHGHLITKKNGKPSGFRTCLAYYSKGYGNKVNYYSNPDVTFPATGTPTGVEGVSNNAKVMTEVRFNMAAMGDESGTCRGAPAPVKTNGQWGKWSKWGECEANCKKTRVRQCDNPSPSNGGKDCRGVDEAERVCSGGKCGTGEGCEGCESCTKNMKWTPIIDCREELQLALTPVVEDGNLIKLETQKFDPKNNLQLWKQNIHGVLINKGLKKAIYADVFDFYMDTSKKVKKMKGVMSRWSFNKCTESSKENGSIVDKMQGIIFQNKEEVRSEQCIEAYSKSKKGSKVAPFFCDTVNPVLACFKMKNFDP